MLQQYKTLFPYFKKWAYRYILGFLLLILTNTGQMIIPQILKKVINKLESSGWDKEFVLHNLFYLVIVAIVIAIGRFGWRFFIHGVSRSIVKELTSRLFNHLMKLGPKFYGQNKAGDLMARATNDMNSVRMATGMAVVAATDGIFLTVSILIILFVTAPKVALFTILPLPVLSIAIVATGPIIGRLFKSVQEKYSAISAGAQEAFGGARVIKSFVRENYFTDQFLIRNQDYKKINLELVRIWGLFEPFLSFLSGMTTLLLLAFGGRAVVEGTLSPGDFVAFLSYLSMLLWPMMGAGFTINMLQRGAASLERINAILQEKPEIMSPDSGITKVENYSLTINDLNYSHEKGKPILSNINLSIKQGQILGILGPTGSGKSTLINLLPRIYDPDRNTIFLGGQDVHDYELTLLRKQFGFVPQESFLFSDTIKNNILYGLDNCSEKDFNNVVSLSTIDRDVEGFPHKWNTMVGEKGVTLSGGQKQRIAISRALLLDPPILVLDDALSAVDANTEALILEHLMETRKDKTTILISHRISTLKKSDNIIVIENGIITQKGQHKDLMKKEGHYQKIAHLQHQEQDDE
ncbi:ABC transporter ATP-binding protein [Spirochaeta cellobiosiphila]|uniref:ABC transporter ATP-binding protein n=1 Tax=Spirochaeta cellobiosiphila TaxID=504483 RepID=UPI000428DECD|nr:ABC transporter ATP-binding protein [Spirochaeta cellobiosiphila]